jgi:hypothetical protein
MEQDTEQNSHNAPSPITIPVQDIYKINILNETGQLERIHVFCGNYYTSKNNHDIFSDIQLAYFAEKRVDIVFADAFIYKDDTIRKTKRKIVQELVRYEKERRKGDTTLSLEEIYMFSTATVEIDMNELYREITADETIPLTKERFFQYATNLNLDPYVLNNLSATTDDLLAKDVFDYDDWIALTNTGSHQISIPIGMEFQEHYDYRFPTNPYHNQLGTEPVRFQVSSKNPLLTFENSLLLNYTPSNEIMVCLAKNVYSYAATNGSSQEYFCELYYPLLQKRGLVRDDLLMESSFELAKETAAMETSWSKQQDNVLRTYHEIYWGRTPVKGRADRELPYIQRGIRKYSVIMKPNDFKHLLPLDLLFKQIHCTAQIPFIKYNPGNRRENMYRLYSNRISDNGKKIPSLDESTIMRLSRDLARGKQISLYIHPKSPIIMHIYSNSFIEITGILPDVIDVPNLESFIMKHVQPVLNYINGVLQSSGYKIRSFHGLAGSHIERLNLTYECVLPIDTRISIPQQMSYLIAVFDVESQDITKGAQMRFKRVKNYKEMDAQSALITAIYGRTGDINSVLRGLIDNFGVNEEEALIIYGEFTSRNQMLKDKILENPGFPVEMKMRSLKNELVVEVTDIQSVEYIDVIHIYMDTFLRMSQYPKSTTVSASQLKQFQTKPRTAAKPIEPEVENVIVSGNAELRPAELYKVQPVRFGEDADDDDEEPVSIKGDEENVGITFDYADEYEYEDVGEDGGREEADMFYGGVNTPDTDADVENEKYNATVDGMPIKNPSPFFRRMMDLDPVLFVTEETGKFPLYSKACPSGDKRQPVILTEEEKRRIDETNPGSYGKALQYGSDPNKQNWYICPRYWCLKTNSSISEEDVKAGKCGAIIPRGADKVPSGAYVYEFNNPKVHMKDGKYVQHVPGFLKKDKHPGNLCVPCCFGKAWDSKDQVTRRGQCNYQDEGEGVKDKPSTKTRDNVPTFKASSYIIGSVSYPIPNQRWGFLPMSVQLFFKTDNSRATDPQNPALIRPNVQCLLRRGVEKTDNQSFMGCVAYYYAYKHSLTEVPTIDAMRSILARSIDLDMFVRFQNGNLASVFRPEIIEQGELDIDKYSDTAFYKTINVQDETQLEYLEDTIAAYEKFLQFLQDDGSFIDYTYLWDIISERNSKLMKDGFNWVILKLADNDSTEKVQMVCPSNAYSTIEYDPRKETVILVQQGSYFEPVHLYEQLESIVHSKTEELAYAMKTGETIVKGKVVDSENNVVYTIKPIETKKTETVFKKAFLEHTALDSVKEILHLIKHTSKKYCSPLPSMPRKYSFKRNLLAQEIIRLLKLHQYNVEGQVLNYRNKVVGLRINKETGQELLYVPCFPSAKIDDLPSVYMDDPELWIDYRKTRDRLVGVSVDTDGKVFSKPKVKIIEDGLVVGFLTETNQFVQINPPTQPIDTDGIESVKHSSYAMKDGVNADKILTTEKDEERARVTTLRNITLETQFYILFRTIARIQLNDYDNRKLRQDILAMIEDASITYHNKIDSIEKMLKTLLESHVTFQDFDTNVLETMGKVFLCNADVDGQCGDKNTQKYCLTTEGGSCSTIFPKKHLLGDRDNVRVYYGRLADELLRYKRVRVFMFQPKSYLNITPSDFEINDDELFLLESALNREYFRNLVPYNTDKYIRNIEYDTAQPSISQNYQDDLTLDEQAELVEFAATRKTELSEYIVDCIKQTKVNVMGNEKPGSWRPIFPKDTKEVVFGQSIVCSFIPLIYIFQEIHKKAISMQNIKTSLWNGYRSLMEVSDNNHKIISILRNQGKRDMMDSIKNDKSTLEQAIFSDEYYITDLDCWVFCKVAKMPVIMFSSTTMKFLINSVNWIQLGRRGLPNEKFYFVRSPVDMKVNTPPAYHVLQPSWAFSELKGDMFLRAERGETQYSTNIQSLDSFLAKYHLIKRK